ncbi:MAG: Cof-type HAD-IIB family hydrolase [Tissierellales bacterium]|nr:Cof-type HAD-IIB family hydrolase [Tissierellales bacterium]
MDYKMIALDLDGTTLNSDGVLELETRRVLNCVKRKNIKIIVCTGRIFGSARYFSKELETDTWIVSSNGAFVAKYDMSDSILSCEMDRELVEKTFSILEDSGVYYHFYDHIHYYTKEMTYRAKMYDKWNKSLNEEDRIVMSVIDNPIELIKNTNMPVYKIVVHDKDCELISKLKSEIADLGLEVVSSIAESFDIMKKGATKGNALKCIADEMGIDREEIIAIGDNENDISMIEFAGLGVAVGNAELCLKEKADLVIESNDNQGVAKFLRNLCS